MIVWETTFQVHRPLPAFPVPHRAACEQQVDVSYHNEGSVQRGDSMVFVYTLEGSGMFRVKGIEHSLPPGTGFLCRTVDPDIAWHYPQEAVKPWIFVWINFRGQTAETIVDDMNREYGYVYALPKDNAAVRKLVELPNHPQMHVHALAPHAGGAFVFELLTSIAASIEVGHMQTAKARMVRQAQEMIRDGMCKSVSIANIAARFQLSREHFGRVFKEQTGQSPGAYVQRQKILLACRFLKESRLSCKEISARLGYNSPTNFSRTFRSALHMSPREFRDKGSQASL